MAQTKTKAAEKKERATEALALLNRLRANETDLGGIGYVEGTMDRVRGGMEVPEHYLDRLRSAVAALPDPDENLREAFQREGRRDVAAATESIRTFERALEDGTRQQASEAIEALVEAAGRINRRLNGPLVSEFEFDDPAYPGLVASVRGRWPV